MTNIDQVGLVSGVQVVHHGCLIEMGQLGHIICLVKLSRIDFVHLVRIYFPLLGYGQQGPSSNSGDFIHHHHRFAQEDGLLLIPPEQGRGQRPSRGPAATHICFRKSHFLPLFHESDQLRVSTPLT